MATKPKAARGKVTRKEKLKRMFEKIKENRPKKIDTNLNMSPGAMGGRTPRSLKQMAPNIPEIKRGKPIRSELEDFFKRSDEVATKLGGMMGTAGSAMKKEFKDGGEVMDLTTEVDVE